MAHRTLIGPADPDGRYTARWLQHGDHPDQLMTTLRAIWTGTVNRHTPDLCGALLERDWSTLNADRRQDPHAGTLSVAGVGLAYEGAEASAIRRGHVSETARPDLEWLYLIDADRDLVTVYEATVHGTWLLHSRHRFDPEPDGEVLGCGGRRHQGHGWSAARVRWPGYEPVFDAEICTGRHRGGFTIARFTDDVAWAICEHTEIAGTGNPGPPWREHLDSDGTDFDLVWFGDDGRSAATRAPRDQDGRILIGAYLLSWQVVEG